MIIRQNILSILFELKLVEIHILVMLIRIELVVTYTKLVFIFKEILYESVGDCWIPNKF